MTARSTITEATHPSPPRNQQTSEQPRRESTVWQKKKPSPRRSERSSVQENNQVDSGADVEEQEEEAPKSLYSSTRFKGYLTLVVSSGVNFQAAYISDDVLKNSQSAAPASTSQRAYAMAVALVSIILSSLIVIAHIDAFTPLKKYWMAIFKPKSRNEMRMIVFLLVWWLVALWVNTGLDGVAGPGKEQHNLYFSSWACFFVCTWTMERWMVSCGYPSLKKFLASWPNRAPGWITVFILSLGSLLSVVDLFVNYKQSEVEQIKKDYEDIAQSQWEWLLFVAAFTLPPSLSFVLVEIFRETKPGVDKNTKSDWETVLEGFFLGLLTIVWIPSVIVSTTPGGVASLVGNAYFFIWGTTVFVIDTTTWWIHDWRRSIHNAIKEQEEEYRNIQKEAFERSQQEADQEAGIRSSRKTARSKNENEYHSQGDDGEDLSFRDTDSVEAQAMPEALGT